MSRFEPMVMKSVLRFANVCCHFVRKSPHWGISGCAESPLQAPANSRIITAGNVDSYLATHILNGIYDGSHNEARLMPIRVDSAARFLCERSGWALSNLELQKLLYLAQVQHAEDFEGMPLMAAGFQAWDYGPVIPALYHQLRMYGADAVGDVFYSARPLRNGSNSEATLDTVWAQFGGVAPGELIELTHWDHGAWADKYEPGVRGIAIGQVDIVREAKNRHRYADEWREITAN